ncbi:TonB-dependent receptor [Fusobacterium sp.]|uniref:TonB-dependent receptor n=1 Tax=Fusobacterium sp. TaxID=68766 RepID=UPI00396C4753
MSKKWIILGLILATQAYAETAKSEHEYSAKLHESIVTTERYEETPVIETARNVTVITGKDIEERGFKDIDEALTMIPGLNQIEGQISIRGQVPKMGDKTVVILVDGVPQNSMDNRVADLDFIPIEQIEKIEVLPSSGSIMYGGNATAGVINIITKGAPDKKYWGRLGTEMGSFKYRKYNGSIGTKVTDRLNATVDYSTSDKKGYRHGEKRDLDFLQIGTIYKLDDGKLGFKYSYNKRTGSGRANALTREEYDTDRKYNKYIGREATDIQNKYIVNFDKKITDNLEASAVAEYRHRDYKYDYPEEGKKPAYRNRDKNTDSLYTNAQLKYTYAPKSNIIIGGDYSKADVDEDKFSLDKKNKPYRSKHTDTKYEAVGGYVLNKIAYNNFLFTQGMRVEKNKFDEKINNLTKKESDEKKYENSKYKPTNTDFELSANYLIDDDKSVYVSFNSVKRSPNLTEYSRWDTTESPSRKSQTLNTIEMGTKALVNNIYISAATFYIHGDKEIMYDPSKEGKHGSFYNLNGKTERIGFELATEEYFGDLTLRQDFTYMHNRLTSGDYKGNEIPGIPAITAGVGATYEMIPNLFLNTDLKYKGRAYFANDFENNSPKASSNTLTDISFRYNMDNGLSVYGGIENLFDKKYSKYSYLSGKSPRYSPAAGRTYYMGLDYKF